MPEIIDDDTVDGFSRFFRSVPALLHRALPCDASAALSALGHAPLGAFCRSGAKLFLEYRGRPLEVRDHLLEIGYRATIWMRTARQSG
jgi:hypothetical protein